MLSSSRMTFFDFKQIDSNECSASYLVVALSGQSYKVKTMDLAQQIASEFASSLGTMAFNDAGAYALSSHDHDIYTSATWHQNEDNALSPLLGITAKWYDSNHHYQTSSYIISATYLSSIDVDSIKHNIDKMQPKLGEMRFFASQAMPAYNNTDFAGWVPLDSTTYQLTNFILSADIRDKSIFQHNSTTFTVPSVSTFMKFNVDLAKSTQDVNARVIVPSHTHTKNKLPIITNINVQSYSLGDNRLEYTPRRLGDECGKYVHVGSTADISNTNISCEFSSGVTVKNLPTTSTSIRTADDFHPACMTMPVYVYVGRSRFSAPLYSFT